MADTGNNIMGGIKLKMVGGKKGQQKKKGGELGKRNIQGAKRQRFFRKQGWQSTLQK